MNARGSWGPDDKRLSALPRPPVMNGRFHAIPPMWGTGFCAIHMASFGGHTEAMRVLVQLGADVNARSSGGMVSSGAGSDTQLTSACAMQTALHYASVYGHPEAIRVLVEELGFTDINAIDKRHGGVRC